MPQVQVSPPHPSKAPPADSGGKLAHSAFWVMTRRVAVVAACIDFSFLLLFLFLGSPILAWLNVVSIAIYGCVYWMLTRRINMPAIALIWVEVLGHAAIGSILAGWDSGGHYYLVMFIPAIVVSGRVRLTVVLMFVLLLFYLGLHAVSRATGVLQPLGDIGLTIVHTFNVTVVFVMAAYTARFYYNTVRRAERKLRELATQDSLTGLSNRRNLLALAQNEIARARRNNEPIAIILADIDHFKQINDRYGHEAGDRAIVHAGTLLSGLCRAQDVVSRWGGEEFLLLLPSTDIGAAGALAERIRQTAAATPLHHATADVGFTFSLGVAALHPEEAFNDAIARADRAMYQSKSDGRDRVTVAR
ncbi:MAG: GGDEF domain-containing protein [Usitatibacteraceae bacterium]